MTVGGVWLIAVGGAFFYLPAGIALLAAGTANERQYIAIMTGGHHFMKTKIGDQVIEYALPANDWSTRCFSATSGGVLEPLAP